MRADRSRYIVPKRDKRRTWWEEKDRERMTKGELGEVRRMLWAVDFVAWAKDGLTKRLECIPYGKERMAMLLGGLKAITEDVCGTIPHGQIQQTRNIMDDLELRAVPKLVPSSGNNIITNDALYTLVKSAKATCDLCTKTGEEARKCPLYKVFEAYYPLDDYGKGYTCPYYQREVER